MPDNLYLYGGVQPWDPSAWTTSDDRVRGGSSVSHLTVSKDCRTARFYGHLDTSTLGGAGFASQHSAGTKHWDLSSYDGLELTFGHDDQDGIGHDATTQSSDKRYLVTLKDEIPPRRDDGRAQSGISWEAEFTYPETLHAGAPCVALRWDAFKPTYRGRPKPDAPPLDLTDVKRIGLMMRSFFGKQDGDFSLALKSIQAVRMPPFDQDVSDSQGAKSNAGAPADQPHSGTTDAEKTDGDLQKGAEGSVLGPGRHDGTDSRGTGGRGSGKWRGVFCGLL